MKKLSVRALIALICLSSLCWADWKSDLKKELLGQEVMLRVDVYKIRFQESLDISQGKDVTNFDRTGFYYKSGLMKDDNPNELANRIDAKGVEVFKAGTLVKIHEVETDDDRVKVKFSTTGDKGAVTFHFEKKEGIEGFKELYKKVFVVDTRAEILAAHPEWPPEILESIKKGEVEIGMDQAQVEATLGPPARIRKSKSAEGTFEIWEYALATKGIHVTFNSGHVEKVEEVEGQ